MGNLVWKLAWQVIMHTTNIEMMKIDIRKLPSPQVLRWRLE